jgi:hypothetical protein
MRTLAEGADYKAIAALNRVNKKCIFRTGTYFFAVKPAR